VEALSPEKLVRKTVMEVVTAAENEERIVTRSMREKSREFIDESKLDYIKNE
jgi:hypothetical protein